MKNHMDHPEAEITLGKAFNLPLPDGMKLIGMEQGNPYCPVLNPDYVFENERFRDMLTFWIMGFRALKIIGDPAAGKTSFVEQWHARLGLPLFIVSCHENMTEADLVGQLLPQENGSLKWCDSPLLSIYRHGGSVLLDEWNNMNPNAATLANAMLEGYAVTIPHTGEIVRPHPQARFFATQNPVDGKTVVQGRYVQDSASDDRFMEMHVDYLKPDLEKQIVFKSLRKVDKASSDEALLLTASKLVDVANEIREKFRSNEVPSNAAFHKPMSTRVLVRWAQLTVGFRTVKTEKPANYAIKRAFSGISSDMREALDELVTEKVG
ncbi:AAA family ATPase (plasmid) [Comamonas aquatica]|nr:AAA family ATPase [Comamonas aquatica]